MWELDREQSWAPKNWCFWTVVLEKTLESPLDCKEIQPVHSKGAQSWVFFWGNDAEAEAPVLWPPHAKSWVIGKDPDAGRDWEQEEKETTEDGVAGWYHRLDGQEFGWTPGVGDGQGGLACCNSWGHKELVTTEQLNWTEDPSSRLGFSVGSGDSLWEMGNFTESPVSGNLSMAREGNLPPLGRGWSSSHLLSLRPSGVGQIKTGQALPCATSCLPRAV